MRVRLEPPLAIALDTDDLSSAMRIVDRFVGKVPVFKVGLELFSSEGPRVLEEIRGRGADVFLDLKINDIPKQAAGAVRAAARRDVRYLTVHSNGGRAMVRATAETAAGSPTTILVVSVLTSLDDAAVNDVGIGRSVAEQVEAMARLATDEGALGLVLASSEVASVRRNHPDLLLVTPGVRPSAAAAGDQKRIGTPGATVAAGADLLVIGRAVSDAPDPDEALRAIVREIDEARVQATTTAGG